MSSLRCDSESWGNYRHCCQVEHWQRIWILSMVMATTLWKKKLLWEHQEIPLPGTDTGCTIPSLREHLELLELRFRGTRFSLLVPGSILWKLNPHIGRQFVCLVYSLPEFWIWKWSVLSHTNSGNMGKVQRKQKLEQHLKGLTLLWAVLRQQQKRNSQADNMVIFPHSTQACNNCLPSTLLSK